MQHPDMLTATRGRNLSGVPVDRWEPPMLDVLRRCMLDKALLAADASASDTVVRRSSVHGRGVFAARNMRQGEQILPFFGQLVWDDLRVAACSRRARLKTRRYGPSKVPANLRCTARTWMSRSIEIRTSYEVWASPETDWYLGAVPPFLATKSSMLDARDESSAGIRPMWVTPFPCCAAGFVNDHRPSRSANAFFYQVLDPAKCKTQLSVPGVVVVVLSRSIKKGEEILVNYGDSYIFVN